MDTALAAAALTAHARKTLSAPAIHIGGRVTLHGDTKIDGLVSLFRSEIKGTLSFSGAHFTNVSGVNLGHASIGTLRMIAVRNPPPTLDLRAATIGTIEDDASCWPPSIRLAMCTYASLQPVLPTRERLRWLRREDDAYHPQPYEQLAGHYRRIGHDDDARTIAMTRLRDRGRTLPRPQRAWSFVENFLTGYGYRPARALAWLILLIAVVALVFADRPPRPVDPNGPRFQPTVYALDVVLPILDFHEERAFTPQGGTQWAAWGGSLAGWLLATTTVAGLSRRLTRP